MKNFRDWVECPLCHNRFTLKDNGGFDQFWKDKVCPKCKNDLSKVNVGYFRCGIIPIGSIMIWDEMEENEIQTIQIEGSLAASLLQTSDETPNTARSDGYHA
jgi:hypothetical protein